MRRLKVFRKSSDKVPLVFGLEVLFLIFALLPQVIYREAPKSIVLPSTPFFITSFIGSLLFLMTLTGIYLFSRFSPVKWLGLRKKLICFTKMFTKQIPDGLVMHSVEWRYQVVNHKKVIVDLFANGLVPDKDRLVKQLSEFLKKNLLKREENEDFTRFTFGKSPERFDLADVLNAPRSERYQIKLYPEVTWDYRGKGAGHNLMIIADTGYGKTMLLYTLIARLAKQGHFINVVDAKDSEFGEICLTAGYPVASETMEDILKMVRAFHVEMKAEYANLKKRAEVGATYATLNKPAHFLVIDELLEALNLGTKKQNAEFLELLESVARLGRSAGYILVIGAQSLNAADASTKLKYACGTKIIMGRDVTDEAFKSAMGLYKKDIGKEYRGDKGKGYVYTPQTGLAYFESPFINEATEKGFVSILHDLNREGHYYGTSD